MAAARSPPPAVRRVLGPGPREPLMTPFHRIGVIRSEELGARPGAFLAQTFVSASGRRKSARRIAGESVNRPSRVKLLLHTALLRPCAACIRECAGPNTQVSCSTVA